MGKLFIPGKFWNGIEESTSDNMAVYVDGGAVAEIGDAKSLEKKYSGEKIVKNDRVLMMPSFIDAHDHARAISPVAFGVEDKALEIWIQELSNAAFASPYTAAYYDGRLLAESGVTTVVHSHNASNISNLCEEIIETVKGYNDAGIKAVVCPPFKDINSGVLYDREEFFKTLPEDLENKFRKRILDCPLGIDEYLEVIDELRKKLKKQIESGNAELQLHAVGGQWCSDEGLLRLKEYALWHNMKIHMHLLETKYQKILAQKSFGESYIEHYDRIGFLGSWLSMAHGVWLTEKDLDIISRAGAQLVINPSSNIRLHSGIVPLQSALKRGVIVGVGLDGYAFDDDQDYIRELRTAMYNLKETGVDFDINSTELLRKSLEGGRIISGERLSSGKIAEGCPADFVCINLDKLEFPYVAPETDRLFLLMHKGSKNMIESVYSTGKKIYGTDKKWQRRKLKAAELLKNDIKNKPYGKGNVEDIVKALSDFYGRSN